VGHTTGPDELQTRTPVPVVANPRIVQLRTVPNMLPKFHSILVSVPTLNISEVHNIAKKRTGKCPPPGPLSSSVIHTLYRRSRKRLPVRQYRIKHSLSPLGFTTIVFVTKEDTALFFVCIMVSAWNSLRSKYKVIYC